MLSAGMVTKNRGQCCVRRMKVTGRSDFAVNRLHLGSRQNGIPIYIVVARNYQHTFGATADGFPKRVNPPGSVLEFGEFASEGDVSGDQNRVDARHKATADAAKVNFQLIAEIGI